MGSEWIRFYRDKVKPQWKIAFIATMVVGLLVHMYKFTNNLPNHDSLLNFYSSQNMVRSGRWFLSIACGFSSYFDLPWVIGVISLVFIACTAILIVEIFHVENSVLVVLCSALLVSFPSVTDTYNFEFTADGYMLAMLLAASAVYCSTLKRSGVRWTVLSACFICLTCAVYQAYISFAFVLALCYFMFELLEGKNSTKQYFSWIGRQAVIYSLGLAAYLIIWKICLFVQNCVPSTYMGIDSFGHMNLNQILKAAYRSIESFVAFFIQWNIFKHGLTWYAGLNILFLFAAFIAVVSAVKGSGIFKRFSHFLLLLVCGAAVPFSCFMLYFVSATMAYSPRMEQSICICYIFAAVLCERWLKPNKGNLAALLLFAIVFNNGVIANKLYYYMNLCYERSYGTAVEMQARIHLTDTGTARSIAWIGTVVPSPTVQEAFCTDMTGGGSMGKLSSAIFLRNYASITQELDMIFLEHFLDFELEYYKTHPEEQVREVIFEGGTDPVPDGWSISFPLADDETQQQLMNSDEVKKMGIWPASDSVQLIGETIVIKLADIEASK